MDFFLVVIVMIISIFKLPGNYTKKYYLECISIYINMTFSSTLY